MNQERAQTITESYNDARKKCFQLARENHGALMGEYAWLQFALSESDIQLEACVDGIGCSGSTYTSQTMDHEWFDFTIPYSLL